MFFSRKDSRARSVELLLSSALGTLFLTPAAFAQNGNTLETVVVTGTSIRGEQPVGSNLITMDRQSIEDTASSSVQQLLTNIPGLSGFGGSPQGSQGVPAALGVHGVGQGSSTATLVLIDGHRFAGEGGAESDPDPNLIPTIALQRVDVLPDGASAIYGSDAVSGVINFITRKNFTGVETSVQTGFADNYNTFQAAAVGGYAWSSGSVLASYEYSSQSRLMNKDRDFITSRQDIRRGPAPAADFVALPAEPASFMTVTPATSVGTTTPGGLTVPYPSYGVNFANFVCPVATIAANQTANAFYYTAAGTYDPAQNPGASGWSVSTSNVPSQGLCDTNQYTSALPAVTSNSAMVAVRQQLSDNVTLNGQLIYGSHVSSQPSSRGTVSAVAFGPGANSAAAGSVAKNAAVAGEINPFYVNNSVTGTTSEFIRYDLNPLLGPGAGSKTISNALAASLDLTWDLGNDREIVFSGVDSTNTQIGHTFGTLSTAEGFLAVNGTVSSTGTAGSGTLPDPLGLGTNQGVESRVLTTLNALDVWNPVATNKTSPQLLAALKNTNTGSTAQQAIEDFSLKFDGPVFSLPAGAVKIAVGAEFEHMGLDEFGSQNTNAGPPQSNAVSYWNRHGRQIWSAFLEVAVPVVSPEMNIPLVRSLNVDLSGRYDRYSGIGDTENPKAGIDWQITDGLKARVSYGTSFVAPNLHDSAVNNSQDSVASSGATLNPTNTIPFNTTLGYNGGAGIAGTWVAAPASCAAGGGQVVASDLTTVVAATSSSAFACKVSFSNSLQPNTSLGYQETGGNPTLQPAHGRNYSAGFDIDAGKFVGALEGLALNVTYYDFEYHNLITNQQTTLFLPQITSFAPPGGWTITSPFIQSFIGGKPVNVLTTSPIWATVDGRLQNAYNIWQNGIDYSINYSFDTDNIGAFRIGLSGNESLRYSTQGGNSGAVLDTKDGKNNPRYPSYERQFSLRLGWNMDGFSTSWTWNFSAPTAYLISNFPYNLSDATGKRGYPVGNPGVFTSSGIAKLGALSTINANFNYIIPKGFIGMGDVWTNGTSISLSIQNVFNQLPPFAADNASPIGGGSGGAAGNPVLREFTLGIRKSW